MKIFNNIDELQEFLPVNQDFTIENLADDLEEAFLQFVARWIPDEQIIESRKPENVAIQEHIKLISLVKRATANLGFMLHFAEAKVMVSDAGITYAGTQKDTKQASDKDKEDLYISVRSKGFQSLEHLLKHLYSHPAKFTIWQNSAQALDFNSLLIRTAEEFRIIKNSFLVLSELYPFIEDVTVLTIERSVPALLLNTLKTNIKNNSLEAIQKELLEKYLRPTLAYLSLALAIKSNFVDYDGKGNISIYDVGKKENDAHRAKYCDFLTENGNNRLSLMTEFIEKNAIQLGLPPEPQEAFIPFRNEKNWGTVFF